MLRSRKPSRRRENQLRRQGYQNIAGLDEVGKGAWAGPLVAAAVMLPDNFHVKGLKDSKLLSPTKREELFVSITKNALQYSIAVISHELVDKLGISQANLRAFRLAIQKLRVAPDYLLLDGRPLGPQPLPHEYLINGDAKLTSIAAASIIAKVSRDQLMRSFDNDYPDYGFAAHKGYGTFEHLSAVKHLGHSPIHRLSFNPVKQRLAKELKRVN